MDKGYSNSNGSFELSGHVDEITPIDPKLNIYHDCNDGLMVRCFLPKVYFIDRIY